MSSSFHPCYLADIHTLHLHMPYVAFSRAGLHSHAHPTQSIKANTPQPVISILPQQPTNGMWHRNNSYGSRHILDDAPFSLWDSEIYDFRSPSYLEIWPEMIIEMLSPPSPISLTVASVAVPFVPPGFKPKHLSVSSNIANPRIPDPVPQICQQKVIYTALAAIASVTAINYIPPTIYVELDATDGRTYAQHSLPGRVGGLSTMYHHSRNDKTNYYVEWKCLCPGVILESASVSTRESYRTLTMATTAGILVKSTFNTDAPRLTVANHGFLGTNDVFHPTVEGVKIGEITESMISARVGSWCSLDSMSSGLVFARITGVKNKPAVRHSGVVIPTIKLPMEHIMQLMGPTGGAVTVGICGAAIVVDDEEDGGVVGFFQLGEEGGDWATCPALDDLMDRGWSVV
ncbi:hypothetical protein EV426DRAFT_681956 [Tirmania nivea]|nr:hypothetical protein EV426DRAFT_681956 [Tirmania nivea]